MKGEMPYYEKVPCGCKAEMKFFFIKDTMKKGQILSDFSKSQNYIYLHI